MKRRGAFRLFLLPAIILVLALLALASTTALAGNPTPPPSWKGPTDAGHGAPYSNPNEPANRKSIVASPDPVRVVIQLSDPPVAQYRGGVRNLAPAQRDARGKLDPASAEATTYASYLVEQQTAFRRALSGVTALADVQYQYQIAFNGIAAMVPGNAIPAIEKMAGVRAVSIARRHEPTMDASLQLIGLYSGLETTGSDQGMWTQLGGHSQAGKGIKIAEIDSGIDQTHIFFNPAGFSYPTGFPKGDTAYTTPKVIVARAYFRPNSPPDTTVDCACPKDFIGHGSHVAGTLAGVYGTDTPVGVKISGVAPQAYLMNYKILYTNIVDGKQYAETPEELVAIEDVVRDGADVVNNSWGGPGMDYGTDPVIAAFNAAMDAGITVVFSAGNDGPSANAITSPGIGQRFIAVGASTTNRFLFYHRVDVSGGNAAVTDLIGAVSSGPAVTSDVGPAPYVDSLSLGNELGCSAFPAGALTGKLALIQRGSCDFAVKVQKATAAGAIGVVVWNNVAGPPVAMGFLEDTTIPSVMVSNTDGLALRNWLTGHPGAQLKIGAAFSRRVDNTRQDAVASFSAKGPNTTWQIKPDLVAPGVDIYSSVPYGNKFGLTEGTSMAAPHVTGVAALVKQLRGDWTPAQIKSAIMTTAQLPASLDPSCLNASGAPYPGPLCRGSGRLFAGYPAGPGDPGLTFDMPSVSVGAQFAGGTFPATIQAKNVGPAGIYSLAVEQTVTDANVTVTPSAASLTFGLNETKPFSITFGIGAAAMQKDYYGMIHLDHADGVHKLHIPYWVRVLPPFTKTAGATVLLIDDDSSNTRGFADYRSYYTAALTSLGITYDVLETDTLNTCASPWEAASKYSTAILFTGDSRGFMDYCDLGIRFPNTSGMNNYLAGGGRLLMFGQDAAYGVSVGDARDSDLMWYFGAHFVQDNVFGTGLPPKPSAQGVGEITPFLGGVKVDFSAGADGAGNQNSNDELAVPTIPDADSAPLFRAVSGGNLSTGMVGTRMSAEPTIERVSQNPRTNWATLGYRTALLSFGLESVNNTTGFITRENLLARLLGFLDDKLSVSFSAPVYTAPTPNAPATLSAMATTTVPSAGGLTNATRYYRWDFGDGSELLSTTGHSASHGYARRGFYSAYVEVMDKFGHKAVAGPVTVQVGYYSYFPLLQR